MNKILIICFVLRNIYAIETTVWNHQLWLDPYEKYSLKWNIDSESQSITFLCEVQSKGWIGFGISPNGGMKGSDLIIAWIEENSGITHFNDRYAMSESLPQIDESQDWSLLESKQNSTHTIIKFSRPLTSCDKEYDRDITRDTIRVIYAYSDTVPVSESDLKMHGQHQRGVRSVLLLSQPDSRDNEPQETDLQKFILNVKNIKIGNKETIYWCKIFKIPNEKIHVVKFQPYITPGNEPFTHHITISACFHPNSNQLKKYINDEDIGSDCTESANMPKDFSHCFNPYFMWAVGGGPFFLPENVGFPLGEQNSDTYLLLNIHYDNPELVEGVIDSSGLELYYTKNYRKYEAFTMSVGSALDNRIFIPPKQPNFHITGHCHTKCFQNRIDQDGINVFAVWPHAHLLARKIKTRHFRGDEELPWIEFDANYDFNLQSFRTLNPMIKIKSGDQLTVECEYDSTKKDKIVFGGFGTYDEMCIAFFYYYPRIIPSKPCFSGLTDDTIKILAGIQDKTELNLNNSLIEYLRDKQDWNQTVLDQSQQIMLNAKQKLECYWIKTDNDTDFDDFGYPDVKEVYKPQERQCASNKMDSNSSKVVLITIIAIIIAIIIVFIVKLIRKRNSRFHNRFV